MSWDKTYSHTLALALDRAAAAVIFNEPDITISSLAWMVRSGSDAQRASLKLHGWQRSCLRFVGSALEYFWPGHLDAARLGDIQTSQRAAALLGPL